MVSPLQAQHQLELPLVEHRARLLLAETLPPALQRLHHQPDNRHGESSNWSRPAFIAAPNLLIPNDLRSAQGGFRFSPDGTWARVPMIAVVWTV